MIDYSVRNKKAWEYNAYEFWVNHGGAPSERAKWHMHLFMMKKFESKHLNPVTEDI